MDSMSVYITEPPPSACGEVVDDGIYIRCIGGVFGGGQQDGTIPLIVSIWPAAGDDTQLVTGTTKRSTVRIVDLDRILAYAPESTWLIGPSLVAQAKREIAATYTAFFGMPEAIRLDNGSCEGMDLAEAVAFYQGLTLTEHQWEQLGRKLKRIERETKRDDGLQTLTMQINVAWKRRQAGNVLARLHELVRRPKLGATLTIIIQAFLILAPEDGFWLQTELDTY